MAENNITILIVEDEKIIAKDIQRTVETLGYHVTDSVSSGEEAIRSIENILPNLILMDIMLKGDMSGIETAKRISHQFSVPIVYLTALTDEETLEKAKITEPFGFLLKPFDRRDLHNAIEIALYKHKMEMVLKNRTQELEEERKKNELLIHHILPADIAKELKLNGKVSPRLFEQITICFTDFYRFSEISSKLPPYVLVNELNDIFYHFDTIIEKHGVEKLKSIGDTYIIVGGLPTETDNHAVHAVNAVMEMHNYLIQRNNSSDIKWEMRSGINSGQVVAGIVGTDKFTYDIWGDAVNIASRMDSSSEPGRINISGTTYELIKDYFDCEYRGKLAAKGKGEIDMYFVGNVKKPVLI